MQLAVDASTLVAEALRARGRALLAHPKLELFVAAEMWGETEHELRNRLALIVNRGYLSSDAAAQLLEQVLSTLRQRIRLVPENTYAAHLGEAQRRVPRDPNDAPTVALALLLNCGIWTADRDFFGCGVPVWTTETLALFLNS